MYRVPLQNKNQRLTARREIQIQICKGSNHVCTIPKNEEEKYHTQVRLHPVSITLDIIIHMASIIHYVFMLQLTYPIEDIFLNILFSKIIYNYIFSYYLLEGNM